MTSTWFYRLLYTLQVLCIITAPVTLIIGSHQDASFAFVAVAIILSSFLAVGLIFVPKVSQELNPNQGCRAVVYTWKWSVCGCLWLVPIQ